MSDNDRLPRHRFRDEREDDWWLAYDPKNDKPHVPKGQSVCRCAHDPCICRRIDEHERYERESWDAITL